MGCLEAWGAGEPAGERAFMPDEGIWWHQHSGREASGALQPPALANLQPIRLL